MKTKDYQPIVGVRNKWYASNKIYASQHGVLLVKVGLSEESYRKLAFSDLCGLSITRSLRYTVWNWVFGLCALVFGSIFYFQDFELPIFVGLAAVSFTGLVVNLVKGKTCLCVLSTKFSHARVRGVTRTRSAAALADFIKIQVSRVQGDFKAERMPDEVVSGGSVDTGHEVSAV